MTGSSTNFLEESVLDLSSIPRSQGGGFFSGDFVATSLLTSRPIAVFLAVGIRFLPDPNHTQNYCFIVMFCIRLGNGFRG